MSSEVRNWNYGDVDDGPGSRMQASPSRSKIIRLGAKVKKGGLGLSIHLSVCAASPLSDLILARMPYRIECST
jgi:hypothetical protein